MAVGTPVMPRLDLGGLIGGAGGRRWLGGAMGVLAPRYGARPGYLTPTRLLGSCAGVGAGTAGATVAGPDAGAEALALVGDGSFVTTAPLTGDGPLAIPLLLPFMVLALAGVGGCGCCC